MSKTRKGSFNAISILLIISVSTKAQVLVNTTGNTLKNSAYVFEYSIGEIAVTTINAIDNNITQGLLQPNTKLIPPPCDFLDEKILSFENPTKNIIRIVGRYDWITDYKMYAADGKLVQEGRFYNNVINISKHPAGLYFVKLFPGCNGNNRVLKVLKQL